MKPCRKNRKKIACLVMDALESSEEAEVTRHLQKCQGCREYHLEISRVAQQLSSVETLATPAIRQRVSRAALPSFGGERRAFTGLNWHFAIPALVALVLGILIFSILARRPATPALPTNQAMVVTSPKPAAELLPTLGNYRAVANQSIDQLDDLLSRQSRRPVPLPAAFGPVSLALLKVAD